MPDKSHNIQLSITQAITAIVISLVVGGITAVFATVRTSDTTALLVSGQDLRITKLENDYMSRSELERQFKHIDSNLQDIKSLLRMHSIE
jgi:hypothetical protein